MREVKRSALVAQSPARMFALINDIESYPRFVPGVVHARIESRSEREIIATMSVKRGTLRAEFTTRNELDLDKCITMKLVRGPFRELDGEWRLTPIGTDGCRVELTLRFAFANAFSALVFDSLFESIATSLVEAFVARAREPKL